MINIAALQSALIQISGVQAVTFSDENGLPLGHSSCSDLNAEKVAAVTAGLLQAAQQCALFDKNCRPSVHIRTGRESLLLRDVGDKVLLSVLHTGTVSEEQVEALVQIALS